MWKKLAYCEIDGKELYFGVKEAEGVMVLGVVEGDGENYEPIGSCKNEDEAMELMDKYIGCTDNPETDREMNLAILAGTPCDDGVWSVWRESTGVRNRYKTKVQADAACELYNNMYDSFGIKTANCCGPKFESRKLVGGRWEIVKNESN